MRLPLPGFLRQGQRRQPRPISVRLKERLNTQEAESRKREEKVRQEGATAVEAARLETDQRMTAESGLASRVLYLMYQAQLKQVCRLHNIRPKSDFPQCFHRDIRFLANFAAGRSVAVL
jgi:hypothetical protein